MSKYILICNCGGREGKAKAAYQILFPNEPLPEIIKGKEAIAKFALIQKNEHIKAIAKLTGKFSYYVNIEDGEITEEYDLMTGKRVG